MSDSEFQLPAGRRSPEVPAGALVDCWNQIGIFGDGSCPELARHVHCRNCPVYSAAGRQLLDRDPPANYRRDWTEHFSRAKKGVVPGTTSVVMFRVGGEWLALPTKAFREVAETRRLHTLPHRKGGIVLGLVNIRGELLPCVSLGRLVGIETREENPAARAASGRLLVTLWQGRQLTFPVQEVTGIHRYHPGELKPPPSTVAHGNANYTRGVLAWQGRTVGCLDEELVFAALDRGLA